MGSPSSLLTLVVSIIITAIVLYFCYVLSKYIGKKYNNIAMSDNMKILERVALAQDKGLVITKICGKLYLIGFANNSIEILKELDEKNYSYPGNAGFNFKRSLRTFKKNPLNIIMEKPEQPEKLYLVGYANGEVEILKELDQTDFYQPNLNWKQRWINSFKIVLKQRLDRKANEQKAAEPENIKNSSEEKD